MFYKKSKFSIILITTSRNPQQFVAVARLLQHSGYANMHGGNLAVGLRAVKGLFELSCLHKPLIHRDWVSFLTEY